MKEMAKKYEAKISNLEAKVLKLEEVIQSYSTVASC
jgi:exonuclease VII small subunit